MALGHGPRWVGPCFLKSVLSHLGWGGKSALLSDTTLELVAPCLALHCKTIDGTRGAKATCHSTGPGPDIQRLHCQQAPATVPRLPCKSVLRVACGKGCFQVLF